VPRLATVLLLTLLLAAARPAAAATDPEGYQAALRQALATLERGDLDDGERARLAREQLGAIGPVAAADGSVVEPDFGPVLAPLAAQPPDLPAASARLRALLDALGAAGDGAAAPDAPARLGRILARPEFGQPQSNPLSDWLSQAVARVGEWLRGWLPELDVAPPGRLVGDPRTPLTVVGLLILLGVLALVATGLGRNLGRAIVASPTERPAVLTWEEVMAEAGRLAQAGRHREAVRALYVATLLRGEALGLLRFDRALTNRELLARAGGPGGAEVAARLAPLIERFDSFWYGGAPGSVAEYDEMRRLASRLWPPT
jgi:hypothetical protein